MQTLALCTGIGALRSAAAATTTILRITGSCTGGGTHKTVSTWLLTSSSLVTGIAAFAASACISITAATTIAAHIITTNRTGRRSAGFCHTGNLPAYRIYRRRESSVITLTRTAGITTAIATLSGAFVASAPLLTIRTATICTIAFFPCIHDAISAKFTI
ncbi:hypothetical protein COU76_05580 [Candidatus Peregrinibacteria bacterium CG10_big_fil_rev_8_21_14_0_10_49_10]|nr:MAG: hypothetical protein COU76_05580 [Candidatus Peregrinibacteria bacterium CG10_big_fil_rev_8_21_14_0_10_49_10]